MKKKAVALPMRLIVLLIILMVGAIIIFIFAAKAPQALCNGNVQTCRTSLALAERSEKFGIDLAENCQGKTYDFEKEDPEEVNEIIAKELEKCVFKFGEGNKDLSGGPFGTILTRALFEKEKRCFKCATFNFDEYRKKDDYKEAHQKGDTLEKYLRTHEIHCSKPKTSFKEYFNFIQDERQAGTSFMNLVGPGGSLDFGINPDGDYILVTIITKKPVTAKSGSPFDVYLTPADNPELAACQGTILG